VINEYIFGVIQNVRVMTTNVTIRISIQHHKLRQANSGAISELDGRSICTVFH